MSKLLVLVLLAACGGKSSTPTTSPTPAGDGSATPAPDAPSGAICGTRGVPECPANQFCNYAPGASCGEADAPGHCAVRPQKCDETFQPVCGCDGKTYSDPCSAAAAAVGIRDNGTCK
jgi:hypothetical protein